MTCQIKKEQAKMVTKVFLVSLQIRAGSTVVLPWNVIVGFSDACTMSELYSAVTNGSFWIFIITLVEASHKTCVRPEDITEAPRISSLRCKVFVLKSCYKKKKKPPLSFQITIKKERKKKIPPSSIVAKSCPRTR